MREGLGSAIQLSSRTCYDLSQCNNFLSLVKFGCVEFNLVGLGVRFDLVWSSLVWLKCYVLHCTALSCATSHMARSFTVLVMIIQLKLPSEQIQFLFSEYYGITIA